MSCEICGRSSCTKVFHSIDEQNEFDGVADKVKERIKEIIINKIKRIKSFYGEENEIELVSLDAVIDAVNNAD